MTNEIWETLEGLDIEREKGHEKHHTAPIAILKGTLGIAVVIVYV